MSSAQKKIIITIDTEAQLLRASCDHVAKLIYGDFGTGENYGIMEMMQLANKYEAKLVFFLDVAEIENFGEEVMKKVVSDIYENGHDVQIHFHVDQLPVRWTTKNKVKRKMLDRASYDDVMKIFSYIEDTADRLGIKNKIAFRGGAWRYNEYVVSAMRKFGYKLSFHYNPSTSRQKNLGIHKPIFRYPNGILEVPLSTHMVDGALHPYNILGRNVGGFGDTYEDVIVIVLHSWSLLAQDASTGYFKLAGRERYNSLENFFKFVQESRGKYKIVDSYALYDEIKNNEYTTEYVLPPQQYIQFDYQNVENREDRKTILRDVHAPRDVHPIKVIGEPVYSADSKRITIAVRDGNGSKTDLVLVNNKLHPAHISNVRFVEDKPGLAHPSSRTRPSSEHQRREPAEQCELANN